MEGTTAAIDPSTVSFGSSSIRRRILTAYWITVALAIPLWWKLTSIDRLSLPESRVADLAHKEWQPTINVEWKSQSSSDKAQALKDQVQRSLRSSDGIGIQFVDTGNSHSVPSHYEVIVEKGGHPSTLDGRKLIVAGDSAKDTSILAEQTIELLQQMLWPSSSLGSGLTQQVVQYSPRYRLAFTLLQQDATTRKVSLLWDIQRSIEQYLNPTLDKLSILHNFTVESQVQYHAPLAFTPTRLDHGGEVIHGLTQEDLSVFVNSAEWTLSSSVSNDPVLHFVLFVPSEGNTPLYILDYPGLPSGSNAFILPQWGGIVLLNQAPSHLTVSDLRPSLMTFRHQLMALLGVPSLPPSVISDAADTFSDWQLDALIRRRAQENIKNSRETLQSIAKLVNQIQNMPVGQDVKGDVQDAIVALEQTFAGRHSLEDIRWNVFVGGSSASLCGSVETLVKSLL